MAYPGEQENVDYMQYVEDVSMGGSDQPTKDGRPLSKEEYRKHRKKKKKPAKGARSVLSKAFAT